MISLLSNFGGCVHASQFMGIVMEYKYFIIFPLACIEGPMLSLPVGFLASLGYVNPFVAYGVLCFGDVIPDTVYFYLGRYGRSRSILQRYHLRSIVRIEWLWHRHGQLTMLFTKLAYGFSVPLLVTAGLAHLRPGKFFRYAIPVTLCQYAVLLSIGYYFGASYIKLRSFIERADLIIALGIIAFILLYLILAKHVRAYLEGK